MPINGIFTGGFPTWFEPRMIPHFVLMCWVFLIAATFPWTLLSAWIAQLRWYQSVSFGILFLTLLLRFSRNVLMWPKNYRDRFLDLKSQRCVFEPKPTP